MQISYLQACLMWWVGLGSGVCFKCGYTRIGVALLIVIAIGCLLSLRKGWKEAIIENLSVIYVACLIPYAIYCAIARKQENKREIRRIHRRWQK